mmetsp:Transcript_96418/g.132770  ORF Transcript_96418/g.132770 Transcript_96418/m.132770 type:complete len:206 (+) Transcript_96418:18-635(+)
MSFWSTFAVIYVLVGWALFEYAWSTSSKWRDWDEIRDRKYPAFRRTDVKKWSRCRFMPGAFIWMPFRCFLMFAILILVTLSLKIALICHDIKKPMSKCRRITTKAIIRFFSKIILIDCGVWLNIEQLDFDYSEWLGADYKEHEKPIKKVSTFVMNHWSLVDVICLTSTNIQPAFCAKAELRKIPIVGMLVELLQCIFIERAGTTD